MAVKALRKITLGDVVRAWRDRSSWGERESKDEVERRVRDFLRAFTGDWEYQRESLLWWIYVTVFARPAGHRTFIREHLEDLSYTHDCPFYGVAGSWTRQAISNAKAGHRRPGGDDAS